MSHEGWAVRGYIEWWMAILYLVLISKAGCTLPLHAAESFKSLVSMLSYVQFAREHMICFESSVVRRRNMAYRCALKEKAPLAPMAIQMVLLAVTRTLATG
jgi:hypothetical protein